MTNYYNIEFEYVPNTTYKAEHAEGPNLKKEGYDVLCKGFILKMNRPNKDSINWLCQQRKKMKCPGSITIQH